MPCICLYYVYKYIHYQLIISYIWLSFWKRENWAGWSPFYISLQNLYSRTNHRYLGLGIYSPSYPCYQAYGISSKGTTRTIPSVKTVAKWWLLNCGICENELLSIHSNVFVLYSLNYETITQTGKRKQSLLGSICTKNQKKSTSEFYNKLTFQFPSNSVF